jgi:KDO2-lipid IV(A) lauroyltransferase
MVYFVLPFLKGSRKRVFTNLDIVFGNKKSKKEKKNILFSLFYNSCADLLNMVYFAYHPERLLKNTEICGQENLKKALNLGKGVICISGHFGNFPLMLSSLSLAGYPINTIIRQARNENLERFSQYLRKRLKIEWIYKNPTHQSVKESIIWLKKGGVLSVLMDQHIKTGLRINFFNQKVYVPAGPATLARRLGCPVLPIIILRKNRGQKIIIGKELELSSTENSKEDIYQNTVLFNKIIEDWVKKYPEDWFTWLHKRFR